jgi:CHAD domain-containing protein
MPEAGPPTLHDTVDLTTPPPAAGISATAPAGIATSAEASQPSPGVVPTLPADSPSFTPPEPGRVSLAFHPDESLALALRRVALDQFAIAIDGLAAPGEDRDGAVHEARKALKRLRALLRLVRDELGETVYRNENVVLRDVGRLLAPVRDSWVMATSIPHLQEVAPGAMPPEAYHGLHRRLVERHLRMTDDVLGDRQRMLDIGVTLRTARARFASWPVADAVLDPVAAAAAGAGGVPVRHRIPDAFSSLDRGMARVYRRGRRAMRSADRVPTEAVFHEWRKRVKYLRYQVEALSLLWPNVLGALEASLGELADVLGDEHDLAVLGQVVTSNVVLLPVDTERYSFLTAVARQRIALQRRAFGIGRLAYAEAPPAFVARMRSYWRSSVPTWRR